MGIINGTPGSSNDQLESDVVVTATLMGFLATRVVLCQPVKLHIEYDADGNKRSAHNAAVDKINTALKAAGYNPAGIGGIGVADTQTYNPNHSKVTAGIAITGRPGGAARGNTHRSMQGSESLKFASDLLLQSRKTPGNKKGSLGLLGNEGAVTLDERGAYYGVVDDPVTKEVRMISTVRRLIKYSTEGGRWNKRTAYHGLIGGPGAVNSLGDARGSWGSFEKPNLIRNWAQGRQRVVGYCHGMNWAIQHCKLIGPWTTPYEVAVGDATNKLASCFGCTTFMYATGYPPSAIHLGRAESWVPLPANEADNPDYQADSAKRMIDGLNEMWAADVAGYLQLGSEIMQQAGEFTTAAKSTASSLRTAVGQRLQVGKMHAANLFLDALTEHEKEISRLGRMLK